MIAHKRFARCLVICAAIIAGSVFLGGCDKILYDETETSAKSEASESMSSSESYSETEAPVGRMVVRPRAMPSEFESFRLDDYTLSVAVANECYPFCYNDEEGNLSGFDIEMMNGISDRLGVEIEYHTVPLSQILSEVSSGTVDAAVPGIPSTTVAPENVSFSYTYYLACKCVVVNANNSDINSAADLNNKTVGTAAGTTSEDIVKKDTGVSKINVYVTPKQTLDALQRGEIEAAILDVISAKRLVKQNPSMKIIGEDFFLPEYYAVAIPSDDPALLNKINAALDDMISAGVVNEIKEKYNMP